MVKKFEQFQDMIARLYPDKVLNMDDTDPKKTLSRTVTFQVTDKCSLACKYCYQINKGVRRMKFETAKKLIDAILEGDERFSHYINPEISPGIVLEFIGGEPFLEPVLIEQICDYFVERATELCHPWATMFMISIASNGVHYFEPDVQHFIHKYAPMLSLSVTIDGNKELHDSCRVFPDGRPSYDLAVAACNDWMAKGNYMGSKITIAPGNLEYIVDAIKHMVDLGYDEINANCVYEEGWTMEHAKIFYEKLKEIGDYWIDNNLVESHYLALFIEDTFFKPKDPEDLGTWCGGTGSMLACDPDGYLFPCIRFMESSLGTDQKPICFGHVDYGIAQKKCHKECKDCLDAVNRKTQCTGDAEKCFDCPIAAGCSDCAAYNYQVTGRLESKAIYICCMHKARALANAYFWNKWYQVTDQKKVFKIYIPEDWALEIIDKDEWETLKEMEVQNESRIE